MMRKNDRLNEWNHPPNRRIMQSRRHLCVLYSVYVYFDADTEALGQDVPDRMKVSPVSTFTTSSTTPSKLHAMLDKTDWLWDEKI
jgi:hypothetical protein